MPIIKVLLALLLSTSFTVSAELNKIDAEKWLIAFRAAKDKATDAMFINNVLNRTAHTQVIEELEQKAIRYFGEGNDCTITAHWFASVWKEEVFILMNPSQNTNIRLSGIVRFTWEAAERFTSCRKQIEAMKNQAQTDSP